MNVALWLADLGVKSTVLFMAAGLVVLALYRRSAALRHLALVLALSAALFLPALSFTAPRWSPPIALPLPRAGEAAEVRGAEEILPPNRRVSAISATSAFSAVSQLPTSTPSELVAREQSADRPSRATWASQAAGLAGGVAASWTSWLVPLWAAGSALVLAALGLAVLRTRRLRQLGRPAPAEAQALLKRLTGRLDLRRPVALLALDGDVMPMTFGVLRPVVLLPAAAAGWSDDRLRAVLLHELAHVKRHDCLTQLVARFACALYWFNPLVWIAARRLRVERELACDDLVLAAGSRASDYATHLLEIARGLRVSALAGVASIAMARPSQLAGRLLAVLDGSRAREGVTGRLAAGGVLAALALIVPLAGARTWEADAPRATEFATAPTPSQFSAPSAFSAVNSARATWEPTVVTEPEALRSVRGAVSAWLPAQSAECAWDAKDGRISASHNVSDDRFTIGLKVGSCALEVDGEGKVTFSENDDDVAALSRGGFFHIEERDGDTERRVEVEPGPDGLERRWFIDGKALPYDAEARAWLARTLLVVFRRTGFDAERRAQRILQKGGVDAVLAEVAQIPSDYAARQYYQVLLTRPNLDQATLLRVVRQAGQEIGSDFELAGLLIEITEAHAIDATLAPAFFDALASVSSDFERHRVLTAVARQAKGDQAVLDRALEAAAGIRSDFELASFLSEVSVSYPADRALPPSFLKAAGGIHSGFELRRALSGVVTRGGATSAQLASVLEAAGGITSDFELAELLVMIAQRYPLDDVLRPAYFAAARHVGGDFEHGRALKAVIARQPLAEATVLGLLESAADLQSDFELAEVLIAIARAYPVDDRIRPAFLKAAEHISSEHERGRVLSAIFPRTAPAE